MVELVGGGMVPLMGGGMVELVGGGMVGMTDTAPDSSAELAFPQMSATPPADIDNVAGVAPGFKSTYAASSPGPCRPVATVMPAPSAPYTRTLPMSTFHTASLNDTLSMPVPASYSADDTCGGAVSSYDIATLRSSAL